MAYWVSFEDLRNLAGESAAVGLASMLGGIDIFVPQKVAAEHKLARAMGLEAAQKLCEAYGTMYIAVPNRRKQKGCNKQVMNMMARGHSAREIALALDLTERHVRFVIASARNAPEQATLPGL